MDERGKEHFSARVRGRVQQIGAECVCAGTHVSEAEPDAPKTTVHGRTVVVTLQLQGPETTVADAKKN